MDESESVSSELSDSSDESEDSESFFFRRGFLGGGRERDLLPEDFPTEGELFRTTFREPLDFGRVLGFELLAGLFEIDRVAGLFLFAMLLGFELFAGLLRFTALLGLAGVLPGLFTELLPGLFAELFREVMGLTKLRVELFAGLLLFAILLGLAGLLRFTALLGFAGLLLFEEIGLSRSFSKFPIFAFKRESFRYRKLFGDLSQISFLPLKKMDGQGWMLVLLSFVAICVSVQLWYTYKVSRKVDWMQSVVESSVDEALSKVRTGRSLTDLLHESFLRVFRAGKAALKD